MSDQVKYTNRLKGARVLVVGGSSGIGFGVAEALVEHGASVVVSSSNPDRVNQTIDRLRQAYPSAVASGVRVDGYVCDVGNAATADANIKQLLEKVGVVDHIVWTAGDPLVMGKLEDMDLTSIQQAGMVRFFALFLLAKYAPRHLSGGPKSSITCTTGAVAEKPRPDWTVVGAYAAGLLGLCRGLALDLRPIRVNVIATATVDTEIWANHGMSPESKSQMFDQVASTVPTGKVGAMEDIAHSYLGAIQDYNMTGVMVSSNSGHLLI